MFALKHRDEMPKCESGESRKKQTYGIWLNPKCFDNRQSATKPRIEERSETIPRGSRGISD